MEQESSNNSSTSKEQPDIAIKHVKVGRPKNPIEFDRKEYNKSYYRRNKEKTEGTYECPVCHLLCSVSNRSRHLKSSAHKYAEEYISLCYLEYISFFKK